MTALKVLIYGYNGWIGKQLCEIIRNNNDLYNIEIIEGKARADNEKDVDDLKIEFRKGKHFNWNKFRRKLNDYLVDNLKIHEDKLI